MSWLTSIIRAVPGGGTLLNAIEGIEHDVATNTASTIVTPIVQQGENVAITDVASFLGASATAVLGALLGPAATIPEEIVSSLIAEFEASLHKSVGQGTATGGSVVASPNVIGAGSANVVHETVPAQTEPSLI
jgi:hypothetical protein